jgi:nondiscriminating glutamyl-tRNA synthetase
VFAHVPLILNRDRSKMSKRAGEAAVAVADYRRAGYVPEALLSYLGLLGFHPGDDREILSRDELLAAFSIDRVGSSGSVFDPDKLRWVNAHYLHHASLDQLVTWSQEHLPPVLQTLPAEAVRSWLDLVRGNLTTLGDLDAELAPYFEEPPTLEPDARASLGSPRASEILNTAANAFASLADWTTEPIKSALRDTGTTLGVKGRELFQPVRAALTGRSHGPELPRIAVALGQQRSVMRLRAGARQGLSPGVST